MVTTAPPTTAALTTPPEAYVFTATKDLMLPATVTGSWPRPRWYTENMWGRPLDTMMMNPWYREQFSDAHAIVVSDQERVGLDILTTGDYHLDEDVAGRSWHHYPLQRWQGLEEEELQTRNTRSPLLSYPVGTMLDSIYKTWRWPRVVGKVEARSEESPGVRQDLAHRAAERRVRQADQVRHLLGPGARVLPRQPHVWLRPRRQDAAHLGHGRGHEPRAAPARRGRLQGHPDRGAHAPLHGLLLPERDEAARLPRRLLQPRDRGARRRRGLDPHLLGQPEHAEGLQRRVVRELGRDLPRPAQGRRLDDRGLRERPQGAAALRAAPRLAQEEDRRRRDQPPHAPGGLPGRRRRPRAQGARVHPGRQAHPLDRLRLRAPGLQPAPGVLQGRGDPAGAQHRAQGARARGALHRGLRRAAGLGSAARTTSRSRTSSRCADR